MKKILLGLFVGVGIVYGSVDQVQALYNAAKYEEAIAEVKKSTSEFGNPQLHLLWAKSAEALGRDEEAMSAYERVEILDENNIKARIALIKIYKRTGREDLVASSSKELQKKHLSQKQLEILKVLNERDLGTFNMGANVAVGYDTNINVASEDLTGQPGEAIETMFTQMSANVGYQHELETTGGWYLRGDLQAFKQKNFDTDAELYDLLLVGASFGAGYSGSSYDIYIPVAYENINYLEQDLLTQLKMQPRLNYTLSNDVMLGVDASYMKRSYTQSLQTRDDTSYGVGGSLYYIMGKDFVSMKLKYENYSADNANAGLYVEKSIMTANLGLHYAVADWFVMQTGYKFYRGVYEDNDRKDSFRQLDLKLTHSFTESLDVYISGVYTQNRSDISAFEYTKNVYMFGIALNY